MLANEGRDWGPLRLGMVMLFCCCCEIVLVGGVGMGSSAASEVIFPRLKLRVRMAGLPTGGGGGGLAVGCLGLEFCGGGGGGATLGLLGVAAAAGGGGGGPGFRMELVEEDGLALGVKDGVEFCKGIHQFRNAPDENR